MTAIVRGAIIAIATRRADTIAHHNRIIAIANQDARTQSRTTIATKTRT
jgi:hypothetical protein